MQTLIKRTRAYALMAGEKERGFFAHAYLIVLDDEKVLRDAMKTFVKLFFDCERLQDESARRVARLIDEEHFSDCLFFPGCDKKFAVEDVERIVEESTLKPVEGEEKTFVICDFAQATPVAQNKLLKLLEEPPKGVRFLLGATSIFPVLPTVLSRVKTMEIPPFSEEEIAQALEREFQDKYTQSEYALCAAASGGSYGAAQGTLASGAYKKLIDEAFALALAEEKDLPALIKKSGESKKKKQLLSLLRTIWRDAMMIKIAETAKQPISKNLLLKAETERLKQLAGKRSSAALVFAQDAVSKAEKQVTFNAFFPQCLEVLLASVLQDHHKE